MPDLTAFLLARIGEDEEMARSGFSHPNRWVRVAPTGTPNGISCTAVLAECEAKKRIIAAYQQAKQLTEATPGVGPDAALIIGGKNMLEAVLETLAAIYADHPDFDPSWRAE